MEIIPQEGFILNADKWQNFAFGKLQNLNI